MMRKVLLITIVVCFMLTGCGKKNEDKKSSGSANLIAPENADSYLLTLDDMPSGWSQEPQSEDDSQDDPHVICLDGDTTPTAKGKATIDFKADTFGPYLSHSIGVFETEAEAKAEMTAYNAAIDQCQTWTETDEDGKEVTYTLTRLSSNPYGDESFGARMNFGPGEGDIIYFRRGNVVVTVSFISIAIAGPQDNILEDMTKKAAEKFK